MKKNKNVVVDTETGQPQPMPRIKTWADAHLHPKDDEKNTQPSATVPNQTMTVLEMVQRHRKGLPIEESRGALYQGEDLRPNLDDMDLVDRAAYIDSVADALVEVKARLEAEAKTQKEKDFLKKVDDELRIRLKKIKDQTDKNVVTDLESE